MNLTDRAVLVTGANGFVGARATQRLAAAGATVHAMVRTAGTAPVGDRIIERVGDFSNPTDIAQVIADVDLVLHTAATAGPDWDAVRQVNTEGTRVVATAARVAGVPRLVHISTYSIYDRSASVAKLTEVTEDTPTVTEESEAANPYSVTKMEAEQVLAEFTDDLDIVILRPPAVFGAAPTSTWGQRVPDGLREGKLLMPIPAGANLFWIHVDDLVDAAVAGLTADSVTSGRAYNVVAGAVPWEQYVRDLHDMLTDAPPIPDFPGGEVSNPTTTGTRLAAELGVTPSRSYEDALAETQAGLD